MPSRSAPVIAGVESPASVIVATTEPGPTRTSRRGPQRLHCTPSRLRLVFDIVEHRSGAESTPPPPAMSSAVGRRGRWVSARHGAIRRARRQGPGGGRGDGADIEEMERHGEEVDEDIDEARSDWERKQDDPSVRAPSRRTRTRPAARSQPKSLPGPRRSPAAGRGTPAVLPGARPRHRPGIARSEREATERLAQAVHVHVVRRPSPRLAPSSGTTAYAVGPHPPAVPEVHHSGVSLGLGTRYAR